jgi:hypothetical protein
MTISNQIKKSSLRLARKRNDLLSGKINHAQYKNFEKEHLQLLKTLKTK